MGYKTKYGWGITKMGSFLTAHCPQLNKEVIVTSTYDLLNMIRDIELREGE